MHTPDALVYPWLRLVHILAAMTFLGSLVTALWWKLGVDRSMDAAFAARTHRRLRKLDAQVLGPVALLIFATGYPMVRFFGGRIAQHLFVLFGLIFLFTALGLWYFGMRNLGDKLASDAESAEARRAPLERDYARRSAAWVGCAGGAILFVVLAAAFMVFRLPSG